MKKTVMLFVIITMFCGNVFCWETGNDLIEYWKEYREDNTNFSTGMYMGYIAGCLDAFKLANIIMNEANYGRGNLGFEIPSEVTLGQICSIVGKWIDNNPEKWNLTGHYLVGMALQDAFPKY